MKCMFGFHNWSRWEESAKTNIVQPETRGILGYIFIQKRTCHRCGLIQHKTQKIMAED